MGHALPDSLKKEVLHSQRKSYIVFPDGGAYRRFSEMVLTRLPLLQRDRVLYIAKTRVGAEVAQSDTLLWVDEAGEERTTERLPDGASVLLADDFTNSGSTLFGGAEIIKKRAAGAITVAAYVTHFVAKYDKSVVEKFVEKLYGGGVALDTFHCTDTLPSTTRWLEEEVEARAARGEAPRAFIMSVAPMIAQWIQEHPLV